MSGDLDRRDEDRIIGLHAAGLTVRDIKAYLLDLCDLRVSYDRISRVTDAVLGKAGNGRAGHWIGYIRSWGSLARRVKIGDADSRTVKIKAIYVARDATRQSLCEVLGLWIAKNEGAVSGSR